jgi:Family of unknown function (DUF6406)
VTKVGTCIQVGRGVTSDTDDGIGFGGRNAVPASAEEPAKIRIAVWDGKSDEFSVYLREGETFQIAGQTWRVDKIHNEGVRNWYADLTRTA